MEIFWFFLVITSPVAVPFLIMIFLEPNGNLLNRCKSTLKLNSQTGLLEQKLFWLSISIPICYFLMFGTIIWKDYTPDLSTTGLNVFISISKFPLAMLSIAVPLAVTVASFHSTQQTAEQISIAMRKSNLESYYLHRTEFFSYFERYEKATYLDCFNANFKINPRLYDNCFKGRPEEGTPEVENDFFVKIEISFITFEKHIDATIRGEREPRSIIGHYLINACPNLFYLSVAMGLSEIYETLSEKVKLIPVSLESYEPNEARLHGTLGDSTREAIAAYRYARDYYDILCKYAGREPYQHTDTYNYLAWGKHPDLEEGNIEWFHREVAPSMHAHAQILGLKTNTTHFNQTIS
ncbi:hypothetical protein EJ576_13925 [Pseudomonas sp. C 49-2]|uniref:hypothetical protein n=1 Tax=Pseudomonas sp. C 49-2 TaxID=2496849 RepID=UPI000F84D896|nr:hypothetical protein [Pseudomonas sp. C 49-2]RTX99345.1 hypothetical protein EJ576_13925 [Pseudomonas sp. C 49-2]